MYWRIAASWLELCAMQLLFSRYVGELRHGKWVDTSTFQWPQQSEATRQLLLNALRFQPDYKLHAEQELRLAGSAEDPSYANDNGIKALWLDQELDVVLSYGVSCLCKL